MAVKICCQYQSITKKRIDWLSRKFGQTPNCQVVVLRSSQIGSNERLNEVTAEGAGTPIGATSINRSLEIERLTLLRDFKRPGGTRVYGK